MLSEVRSGSGGHVRDHGASDGIEGLCLGGVAVWWRSRSGRWLRFICFSPWEPRRRSTEQEQIEVRKLAVARRG